MRVLFNDEDSTVCVMEIKGMGFDPDVLENDKGGLYFYNADNEFFGIEGIDQYVCEELCKQLFETGRCDLRDFDNITCLP